MTTVMTQSEYLFKIDTLRIQQAASKNPVERDKNQALIDFFTDAMKVVFYNGRLQPLKIYQVQRIWLLATLAWRLIAGLYKVIF